MLYVSQTYAETVIGQLVICPYTEQLNNESFTKIEKQLLLHKLT